jgi:hypothetical protein
VNPLGLWTLQAGGGDIGTLPKKLDSFFFVHHPLAGNGSVLALITGQEGGNPQWSKAGLMLRENETPGARNVFLGMSTGPGLLLTYRPAARRTTLFEGAGQRYAPRRFPTWLRLQREGDTITPFTSTDGFGWTQLHSPITLRALGADLLAGMAVSAFEGGTTAAGFNTPLVLPGLLSPIVQVAAGSGTVLLTWPAVSQAAGYRVRRSNPSISGFAAELLTPDPIRETSFTDRELQNGKPIRYLVSAVWEQDGQLVEGWPTAVVATPTGIPGGLFGYDINLEATQMRGAVLFDPATEIYKISGSGGEIGGTEDRGYFVSRWLTGDFQLTAQLLDKPSQTAPGARAGLMVRESLDGPSRMAFLAGSAAGGLLLQQRLKEGGKAAVPRKPVLPDKRMRLPLLLRLVRRGSTLTSFYSVDGVKFTPAGKPLRFNPALPESLYVGYAITAQNAGAISSHFFRDLIIESLPPEP